MKTLRTTLLTASLLLIAATATLIAQPTPTPHPTVNTIGNMGIGTMRPDSFKLEVAGGIGPSTSNSFSLGSSTRRWEDLFLGPSSLHIGENGREGIIGYDPITQSFLFDPDGDGTYEAIMDANGYIAVGTSSTLNPVTIEGDADQLVLQRKTTSPTRVSQKFNLLGDYWQIGTDNTNSAGQFFFDANGTRRIVFNKNGNVGIGTADPSAFMLEVNGNVGPNVDNTFDLGSQTRRWRDLFVGPNSLHLGVSGNEAMLGYDIVNNLLTFNPSGDGTPEAVMNDAGSTGLGTTTPQSKLDVEGGAAIGATYSGTTAAPANGLLVEGSTGLGTTTPQSKLDVEGGAAIGATYAGTTAAPANGLLVEGSTGLGTTTPQSKLDVEGGAAIGATYAGTTAAPANGLLVEGSTGLGTTTPQSKLDVEGGAAIGATYSGTTAAPANGLLVEGNTGLGTTTPQSKLDVEGGAAIGATYSGTTAAPANGLLVEGSTGLGTTTPQSKLDVEGGAAIGATYSGTTAAPANGLLVEGSMGIGTTSPSDFKLQVAGNVGPDADYMYDLGSTAKRWRGLYLDSTGLSMGTGTNQGFISYSTTTNSFRFNPSGDGTPEAVMDINGNFSVGTTTTDNPATIVGDPDQLVLQPKAGAPNSQRIARMKLDGPANDFQLGMPDTSGTLIFNGNGGVQKMALDQSGNLSVAGNITPSAANRTIGTTSTRWEDLFVGPTSVHIGNAASDETVLSYANSSSTKRMQIDADGDGDNEATITGTGRMGIGTDLPQSSLDVEGGAAIGATYSGTTAAPTNGLLVEGNVGVGTTSTSDFKLQVEGTVGPNTDNSYSLGSASKRWTKVFTSSGLDINGPLTVAGNAGTAGQYLVSQGAATAPTWKNITDTAWGVAGNSITDDTTRYLGTNNAQDLAFATEGIIRARFLRSTNVALGDEGAFVPEEDDAITLGSPERRWKSLYVTGGSIHIGKFASETKANLKGGPSTQASADGATISYDDASDVLVIDKPINSGGTTQPDLNNVFSLGSTTNRWKDLFLGPSTLFIGTSASDEAKISYNTAANELRIDMDNAGGPEFTLTQAGGIGITGKATSAATIGGDPAGTLTTKGYVDGTVSAITLSGDVTGATGTTTIATTAGTNIVAAINASSSTINDSRLAASISRDSESPAAGDVSGSLAAGYSVNSVQSGAAASIITAINASAGSIDAARIGNGLTNTQVNDDLTISGGTIENSPIGATTASTGRFTTITGTTLPPTSTSTDLVTSNSGVLETRTITSLTGAIGVSADSTVVGNGTTVSPLGLDLSETNTWTGDQTFPTTAAQGDALVASVNAASTTINATQIGNGLTNTQVNDDLTISGGTIENSPIGATTASTGRFTTITGTTLPTASTSTDLVTSNSGALETRTIASLTGVIGVSVDSTIVGDGTTGTALGVDLSETNTWTGDQTFPTTAAQGAALVASVNAASTTINATQIGNGLTNTQVNDDLTINGGTIENSPIGATTASTGRFTTITGTTLPSGSTATAIVTSNSGALETRTITSLTGTIGVSVDSTIVGDGTTGSPLGVDLSETNTWTGDQTFPTTAAQGDALIASVNNGTTTIGDAQLAASIARDNESPAAGDVTGSLTGGYSVNSVQSGAGASIVTAINASSGSIDAARIGNGLTDVQVANTLTLTAGSIDGVAIGATTASTGKFTTLTATSETVLSHDNSLVGDANGTIPNGTSVAVITNGTANSDPAAITITLPSAVVGQVLWIYNADANATATLSPAPMAGGTTVAAGGRLMLIYVNNGTAGWVAW
ncbi:MAG: hypothetical protein IT211_01930 [Armatimonadetes bacterium]|nr:hypothetical protein [Armatimonadota bacterium]